MGYPLTHHHPQLLIMKGATYKKKSDGQLEGEHQEVHYVKGEHY